MGEFAKFGEQLGDFLRGLLQVADQQSAQRSHTPGKKYIVVDSTETASGTSASLDMAIDTTEVLGSLTRDAVFDGTVQFASGSRFLLQQVIAKDFANVVSLQTAQNKPGTWNIVADGDILPLSKLPYEITFV